MDRASLELYLGRGLSLAAIGRKLGRHESTVAYWVRKHQLQAAHRTRHLSRGALERQTLEHLVQSGASIAEIAESVDRSKAVVRYWLGKYGLRTRGGTGRRSSELSRAAREAGMRTVLIECPRHGEGEHVRDVKGYFRCRRCRQDAVVRRRRRLKEILVQEAGGRCQMCGYDRCRAALAFHHLDPSTKDFGVAEAGVARSIERLRVEARKCVLLCSNCHAEVESGASSNSVVARLDSPG
jgi:transposase